jgi:nucleoside-diphosphate-sugar epimerase
MKTLVTGAAGFIGSFLVERLVGRGDQVRCLVLEGEEPGPLRQWPVEICYGDICQPETLKDVVKGRECIYHLAGVKAVSGEATYFRVNYEGTRNLAEACLHGNRELKRFIFISSQAAAGPSRDGHRLTEDEDNSPMSAYGRSKRAAERYLQTRRHELPITILRPALVYGPRDISTERGLRITQRRLIPSVKQYFGLIYIEDAVDAMILAAEQEHARDQLYFITSSEPVTWREVLRQVLQVQKKKGFVVPVPWALFRLVVKLRWGLRKVRDRAGRPLDIDRELSDFTRTYWLCSGEKAKRELGFAPKISLREGIERTLRWYERSLTE